MENSAKTEVPNNLDFGSTACFIQENAKTSKLKLLYSSDYGVFASKDDLTTQNLSSNLKERRLSIGHAKSKREGRPYYETELQSFDGIVIGVDLEAGEFEARLVDRTDTSSEDEVAVFSFNSIPDEDLPLVKPGAQFFWKIGYQVGINIPKTNFSKVRFRRLAGWNELELKRIRRNAESKWKRLFGDEQ